jgi:tungstate transport system substrate-binding protein
MFKFHHLITTIILSITGIAAAPLVHANSNSLLLQSTTSTANSGFYDYLLPMFEDHSGIKVNVVAVGTGQAIRNARNCDADVLLVHAKSAEEEFVNDGYGVQRFDLMYNDFVIVGSTSDPASIKHSSDVIEALQAIASSGSLFGSRGDNSGTHKKELALWAAAGIDITDGNIDWYRSTGSGMGATLNTSVGLSAYTLTDRASWISFKNKSDFGIVVEGDAALFNQYGVILVNPEKCPAVNAVGGQTFIDWLLSAETQQAIANYTMHDQQLFFPNAKTSSGN